MPRFSRLAAASRFPSFIQLLALGIVATFAAGPVAAQITTIAGGGIGDGAPAAESELASARGVAHRAGDLFIADTNHHRIRKVAAATGLISTVAGDGTRGFAGDGAAATLGRLDSPAAVAIDATGNLFVADTFNFRVRKVAAGTGLITTVAGNGVPGFAGDGGPAVTASLFGPAGIALDAAGNLFIADQGNRRIRRVDAVTNVITTVAGDGAATFAGDGGAATAASLNSPTGVFVDGAGNLFIADTDNHRIRKVAAGTGIITTVAGNGIASAAGDGGPADFASLNAPAAVMADTAGNLYIADAGNNRVRLVTAGSNVISTLAGTGFAGFSGDGGAPTSASLDAPTGLAMDASGNLVIADADNSRIRSVTPGGFLSVISTVAGGGAGDGGSALGAMLASPGGVATYAGHVYVADTYHNRVRRIAAGTGIITTIAGNGMAGFSGDGGAGTSARVNAPMAVAVDAGGHVFVADTFNFRVRRIDAGTGVITTVAGNGVPGFGGDAGAATAANLYGPTGVSLNAAGDLFIADQANNRVRKVAAATGIITTVAGDGIPGFAGDGGAATTARLAFPTGVAVDPAGTLFIADADNQRVRRVAAGTGIITTIAGTGTAGYSGDGGPGTSAQLNGPSSVTVDAAGNVYVADSNSNRVRMVNSATGVIATVAGNGSPGFAGDGGPAQSASLDLPLDVAVDAAGALFIADADNNRVRKVTRLSQSVTFGAIAGHAIVQGPVSLGASATSSLAVSYVTTTPAVCTVTGASVSLLSAGTCTVFAVQMGDGAYAAAVPVSQSFAVSCVPGGANDCDFDGIPDAVEAPEGRSPSVRDNDVFGTTVTTATGARLFAMQQYRDFLGREGDAGGIAFHSGNIVSDATPRAQVIENFFNSPEFSGTVSPIVRLYFAFFNRIPDYAGLLYQVNAYNTGTPLAAIANSFAASPEFQATYGALDDTQYILLVYQNTLGRTPVQAEIDFYLARLAAGVTRGEVMLGFSESPEYIALKANAVYVTSMYVGMLRRSPEQAGLDFWVAYMAAGNPGQALISGFLNAPEYHGRFLP